MCSLRLENNLLTIEGVRFASISKKTPLSKLLFAFVSLALPLLPMTEEHTVKKGFSRPFSRISIFFLGRKTVPLQQASQKLRKVIRIHSNVLILFIFRITVILVRLSLEEKLHKLPDKLQRVFDTVVYSKCLHTKCVCSLLKG
jgi:hypothetical protein